MKYLVSGFLDVLNEILSNIMGLFTGDFWKDLGISVKGTDAASMGRALLKVGGKFDEWLPGVQYLRESFVYLGMFFVFLLMIFGLLKAFLPDGMSETAEHPFSVIARALGASFAVIWAFQIMFFLQAPMAGIFDGIYQLSTTHKTLAAGFDNPAWGDVSHLDFDKISGGDSKFTDTIGGTLLLTVMSVAVTWMYIKLVLEMVERYVTTCFLFYVSPLAFSSCASKSTQGIASNFIRMLFAQYLLIMFNCIFLFVFCYAYTNMGTHKFASINEAIIYFAALMAWLKLGQRLDEHMNTLGLGAARTGAGLGGELMAAAGLAYGGMKIAGGAIRNGAGFGKGTLTGNASGKTVGGRAGNMTNKAAKAVTPAPLQDAAGKAKDAVHGAAGSLYNSYADLANVPQGLKASANGVLSNRSIADAAMSSRMTQGAAAVSAANQGLTLSSGASPGFESASIGNGHITGTAGGQSYDFVPREGHAVSGPYLSATGPDGKEWVASISDGNGNLDQAKLGTDFARDALGTDSMNSYLNGKWGGAAFGAEGMAGVHQGMDAEGMPVSFADASLFQRDNNYQQVETINGREMLKAYSHAEPSPRK